MAPLPAEARGLDHAEEEEVIALRVHGVEEEMWRITLPVEQPVVDERVIQLVAGRGQDHVILGAGAIVEMDGLPVEPVDIGPDRDVAMARVVEHQRIDHGVTFIELVVGLGKAVFLRVAHEPFQDRAIDEPFQRHRQPDRAPQGVGGPAEDVFWHEMIAPPHREVARHPVMDRVHRDVAAGIARADHQHALAVELARMAVVGGMDQFAVEIALERRHVGCAERAIGNEEAREVLLMRAVRVAPGHAPAVAR